MAKQKLPSGAAATDAEVRRLVLMGKGNMPSFSGRFTEEQMAALLAYLHTDMQLPHP
jgi:mono/diheme cytochrome c family protein